MNVVCGRLFERVKLVFRYTFSKNSGPKLLNPSVYTGALLKFKPYIL